MPLEWGLDFPRNCPHLEKTGAGVPMRAHGAGRYDFGVVSCDATGGHRWTGGPVDWLRDFLREMGHYVRKWPMECFFPDFEDGLFAFEFPKRMAACRAVPLKDSMDATGAEAKSIVLKSHLIWRHASTYQSKHMSVDAEGANERSLACADKVVNQCEVCLAY